MTSQTGRLILESVPPAAEGAILDFLVHFNKKASRENLAEMIRRTPLVLGAAVPEGAGRRVAAELAKLGAAVRFDLPAAPADTAPPAVSAAVKCTAAPPAKVTTQDAILGAFTAAKMRFPVSTSYQLGLAVLAVAMVLLPVLYLGMIGGVGYFLFWHGTENLRLFHTVRSGRLALFLYIAPLIVGALLLLFMVKPLFARRAKTAAEFDLDRRQEPLLFAFVEKLCRTIGAPVPSRIRLDNQVNASAGFRRGLGSFFSNDLVLTIGMPLAGGLTLTEFAGVLAHEFGHFAQASGMRLTYIIRSVNYWFARVVYQEDEWDDRVRRWSSDLDVRLGIIFVIARFFIWLTRKVLWLLMQAGHGISCFMLRQMEFDADRYEAALVGPATFESTVRKLGLLSTARGHADEHVAAEWQEGRLPDDLTALVLAKEALLPTATRQAIYKEQTSRATGRFDTHPADRDRIASARQVGVGPVFSLPGEAMPATVLFRDFAALSTRITVHEYRQALGHAPEKGCLVDVKTMVRTQQAENQALLTLERYFAGNFLPLRPLRLGIATQMAEQDAESARQQIRGLRERIRQGAARQSGAVKSFRSLRERTLLTAQARALVEAGFKIKADNFQLPGSDLPAVEAGEQRIAERKAICLAELEELESLQRERLVAVLDLLKVSGFASRLGDTGTADQIDSFRAALHALDGQLAALNDLEANYHQLSILAHQLDETEQPKLVEAIHSKMRLLRAGLEAISAPLSNVPYPFEHASAAMTLGDFLLERLPEEGDLGGMLAAAGAVSDRLVQMRIRLAARLAQAAEALETALGLPAIAEQGGGATVG